MRGKEVACPEGMASLLFAKWATLTDVPFRKSVDVWSAGIKKRPRVATSSATPQHSRGATCCATTLTAAPAPWCFRLPCQQGMPSRACSRACPAGVSFRTFDRSPVYAEGRETFHACAPPRTFPQGTTGALPAQCRLSHRRSWSFPHRACSCCTLPRLSP